MEEQRLEKMIKLSKKLKIEMDNYLMSLEIRTNENMKIFESIRNNKKQGESNAGS